MIKKTLYISRAEARELLEIATGVGFVERIIRLESPDFENVTVIKVHIRLSN